MRGFAFDLAMAAVVLLDSAEDGHAELACAISRPRKRMVP